MKKLAIALSLLLVLPSSPAVASERPDDQWVEQNSSAKGFHSAAIVESLTPMAPMWRAENWTRNSLVWRMCNSLDQAWCRNPDRYKFDAHYPACTEGKNSDCVTSLRLTKSDGTVVDAKFERYIFSNHPNIYQGNGKEVFKEVGYPSIWNATDSVGNSQKYLVSAGLSGYYGDGRFLRGNFAQVTPVELIPTFFQQPNSPFAVPIPECTDEGCSGINDYEGQRCVVFTQDGFCAKTMGFEEGERVELTLSMTLRPNGWFHGRIKDPEINLTRNGSQTLLTVSAQPVRVPVLYVSGEYKDLPNNIKRYFDRCIPRRECTYSSGIPGMESTPFLPGAERNILAFYSPSSREALEAVRLFSQWAGNKSPASPSTWRINTLDFRMTDYPSGCFKTNDGLQGIVTTNATAYLDGPPKFERGFLNYQVAGLHQDSSGEVFQGTYDLVMRSDVARCLYRLTKAPVSATITVTGEGDRSIATTLVGEKNGWLKLSAYGFTFSQKTIKVKLTQKRTTITCVSTTAPVKTRKVTGFSPKCPTGFKKR